MDKDIQQKILDELTQARQMLSQLCEKQRSSDKLCTVAELADELGRSPRYVGAMRAAGFPMPGGLSTRDKALQWLEANPKFTTRSALRKSC